MNLEDSMAEANRILRDAGWHAHPEWDGAYTRANLVGGIYPDKQGCEFKDWTKIPPGHPLHSADTPDEPHEAAAWLVVRVAQSHVARETIAAPPEQAEGGEANSGFISDDAMQGAQDDFAESARGSFELAPPDALDADFTDTQWRQLDPGFDPHSHEPQSLAEIDLDSPLLEFSEEMLEAETQAEPTPAGQDRFIGLDDLDRRRSLRMGDVMRYARSLMPFWTTDSDAALAELRNFAMGVSEGRWPDDPARSADLGELEATLRRMRAIETARDAKVEFLEAATREQIEAFVVESDWP